MGDELPIEQPSRLSKSTEGISQGSLSQSLVQAHSQLSKSNMEVGGYPGHQLGINHHPNVGLLNMGNMANALPEYHTRQQFQAHPFQQQQQQQQHSPSGTNPSMMYQYHQGMPFTTQAAGNYPMSLPQSYTTYYPHNQPMRHYYYPQFPQFALNQTVPNPSHSFSGQNVAMHQPNVQNMTHSVQQQEHPTLQSRQNFPYGGYGMRAGPEYHIPQLKVDSHIASTSGMPLYQQPNGQGVRRTSSNSSLQSSVLRGPPRKPKQSGHALWVGNLPPGTHIIDLKDHFSKDATDEIESVFLISKSNCAFVNYKSEASCVAAMSRFHDSKFQGVRLVCRLRRGGVHTSSPNTSTVHGVSQYSPGEEIDAEREVQGPEAVTITSPAEAEATQEEEKPEKVKEKFFIVKSLTVEDLERSVHTGVWATQAHNEQSLNQAYQNAENVYLIFSANKSGEYFGYARMQSAIDDEATASIEYPVQRETPVVTQSDLPVTIRTPATASAPKGRVIDDSARGTIFWEADQEQKEEDLHKDEESGNISGEGETSGVSSRASPATPQAFGKPFRITWMSTDRLPFYRTRGLRNPWNANREVKIARDGTELEPTTGRRLVNMFHHQQLTPASTSPVYTRQPGMLALNPGNLPNPALYMHQQPLPGGQMYGRTY